MEKKNVSPAMAKNAANNRKEVKMPVHLSETAPMQVLRPQENKQPEPESEKKQEVVQSQEKKAVSVHDILAKVNELNGISKKHTYLRDIKAQLSGFTLGTSGLADNFTIRDANGNQFSTNNSEIIGKVLRLLKTEVSIKLEETEEELKAAI